MIRKILILLLVFIYPASLYAMGSLPPREYIPLRILVIKDVEDVTLYIKGDYKILDYESEDVLEEGRGLKKDILSADDRDFKSLRILAGARASIFVNKRRFRGNIDILKTDDGKLMVVNHIDIEEYLYGVLKHEVSHRWPLEVLKAQAIAARTYAMYQKLITTNKYYDLTSDIYSQVYGGRTSETSRTRRAVNMTQGMVLMYDDKVFPGYYHATCGGHTSDANSLWSIDIDVMKGVTCNFCRISPHYTWKKELRAGDIQNKLKSGGHSIKLDSIKVIERDPSGRILDILLKNRSKDVKLSGNKFRLLIGPNELRSTNFEVRKNGSLFVFLGRGWGHGIGMCQWGAYGMARQGWKAYEILGYYYSGANIVKME